MKTMKFKIHLYMATLITLAVGSLIGCFYCVPLLVASLLLAVVFRGPVTETTKGRSFKYNDDHSFPGGY